MCNIFEHGSGNIVDQVLEPPAKETKPVQHSVATELNIKRI